jgi:hypothetical protein
MTRIPEISDSFLAAADIEAETPIIVGANMVGPDGHFSRVADEDYEEHLPSTTGTL